MKNILRWLAVLPAAFIGMFVFNLLGLFVGGSNFHNPFVVSADGCQEHSTIVSLLIKIIAAGFCGAGFVICGSYTAPKYRYKTGIVLAVLLFIMICFSTYSAYILHDDWSIYLLNAITFVGGIIGVTKVGNDQVTE